MISNELDHNSLHEMFSAAFDSLTEATTRLIDSYSKCLMPMWSLQSHVDVHNWFATALNDFWYQDGQGGNETTPYVGLVGATPEQMLLVHQVNEAKHAFAETVKLVKANSVLNESKYRISSRNSFQDALNNAALPRLNIKQTWRQLPVAEERVRRVHFSWYSSGRTIVKRSISEVHAALLKMDTDAAHIQIQLKKLGGLPPGEPLAQVKTQSCIMRANILYVDPLPSLRTRTAMNVAMPLFVPINEGEPLPDHKYPATGAPTKRVWPKRKDMRIEEEVFLPSLHVHRYRDSP